MSVWSALETLRQMVRAISSRSTLAAAFAAQMLGAAGTIDYSTTAPTLLTPNQCVMATGQTTVGNTGGGCTVPVASVSALAAMTGLVSAQTVQLEGYYGIGTPGGGTLAYAASCSTDGYLFFADGNGCHWQRVNPTGSVYEAGAYGDAVKLATASTFTATQTTFTNTNAAMKTWADAVLLAGRRPFIVLGGAGTSAYPLATYITAHTPGSSTYTIHDPIVTSSAYWSARVTSIDNGGTGYTQTCHITLGDPGGTVLGVVSVNGSGTITKAYIYTATNNGSSAPGSTQSEASNTCSGSGTVQVEMSYTPTGKMAYGSDDYAAIAAVITAANAGTSQPPSFAANKFFGTAQQISFSSTTAQVIGLGSGLFNSGIVALAPMASVVNFPSGSISGLSNINIDGMDIATDTCRWDGGSNKYVFNAVMCMNGTNSDVNCTGTFYSNVLWGKTDNAFFPNPNIKPPYGLKTAHGCDDGYIDNFSFQNATEEVYLNSNIRLGPSNNYGGNAFRPNYCIHIVSTGANASSYRVGPAQCGNPSIANVFVDSTISGATIESPFIQYGNSNQSDPDGATTGVNVLIASGDSNINVNGCIGSVSGTSFNPSSMISIQGPLTGINNIQCGASAYVNSPQAMASAPGGRIVASTNCNVPNAPVPAANVSSGNQICYVPYKSSYVPFNAGAGVFIAYDISPLTFQMVVPLDSNSGNPGYQQSGKIYDVFIGNNAGTPDLCTNFTPWTTTTDSLATRGIVYVQGFPTNQSAINCKTGATSGAYFNCAISQCVWVGTIAMTADGITTMEPYVKSATGGGKNFIGVWNAFNRAPFHTASRETTTSWHATTASTWEPLNNSTSNSITWVDGQGYTPFEYDVVGNLANASSSLPLFGAVLDSTSATPVSPSQSRSTSVITIYWNGRNPPLLGKHTLQAMEEAGDNTSVDFSTTYALQLDQEF